MSGGPGKQHIQQHWAASMEGHLNTGSAQAAKQAAYTGKHGIG